jgi:hypothetical protein
MIYGDNELNIYKWGRRGLGMASTIKSVHK